MATGSTAVLSKLPRRASQPDFRKENNNCLSVRSRSTSMGRTISAQIVVAAAKKADLPTLRPASPKHLKQHKLNKDKPTAEDKLLMAAENGDLTMVLYLLETTCIGVNFVDTDGWPPLFWAISAGQIATASFFIAERHADVAIRDKTQATALHYAAFYGHRTIVDMCLNNGSDVGEVDENGATPLIFAAKRDQASIGQHLINQGADVEHKTNNGATALHYAVCNNSIEFVEMLLLADAKVYVCDNTGVSPFMYAARFGHVKIGEMLLDRGADINETNEIRRSYYSPARSQSVKVGLNWTPLMIAVVENQFDFIRMLISRRADVTIKNDDGKDALSLATTDFVRKLLSKK